MKEIECEKLKPSYQRFILGCLGTEYRGKDNITLEVYSNGKACITIGYFHNTDGSSQGFNPHGLQENDLHKGKYKTPYFAYKNICKYNSAQDAIDAYNKWLGHRAENIKA